MKNINFIFCLAIVGAMFTFLSSCEDDEQPSTSAVVDVPIDSLPDEEPITSLLAEKFYLGTSMYFVSYLERMSNIVYKEDNIPKDAYQSIADHGGNIIRLSVSVQEFNNEYTVDAPVDWNQWEYVYDDIQRANNAGLEVFLTIPSDRLVPDKWSSLGLTVLKDSIVSWTRTRLKQLGDNGLLPTFISVGNEINIEFMSEEGDYKPSRNVFLLNAVLTLIDEINVEYNKDIKKVIHISSVEHIKWYLGENVPRGLENFDVFANSFYYNEDVKYGEWQDFEDIISWIKLTYDKEWILLETASPFTWDGNDGSPNIFNGYPKSYGSNPTIAIQREVLIDRTLDVLRGGGLGVIYWGGDWVATYDQTYIYPNEWGPGSSWENKTFWDKDYNLHEGVEWMSFDYRGALE